MTGRDGFSTELKHSKPRHPKVERRDRAWPESAIFPPIEWIARESSIRQKILTAIPASRQANPFSLYVTVLGVAQIIRPHETPAMRQ